MKIAVLGIKQIPAVAGADRVVEKLLENASSANEYWVYVRRGDQPPGKWPGHIHFVTVPALAGKHVGSFSFFLACALHYVVKGRYDVAHVHNSDFGFCLPLLRLRRGVPVLATFHGDPYTRRKWGPFARAFLRLSERAFKLFSTRMTSVSRDKTVDGDAAVIQYVPNGVDLDCRRRRAEEPLPIPGLVSRQYMLFACGRLDATKGLHRLLDAYELCGSRLKLAVIGDFHHDPAYSRSILARIEGNTRVVTYRGLLHRRALFDVLSRCAMFVFPSEYEAMSMMLLEAVSCKAPVVCSDIPANLEIVGRDYAYRYPVHDSRALAAMLEAAEQERDWGDITARLYERCAREFSWASIARTYERIYADLAVTAVAAAPTTSR